MFKKIRIILNICLLILLNVFLYLVIQDIPYVSYLITKIASYFIYARSMQFILVLVVIIYDVIIILSYMEVLWKKPKTVKIKTKSGKIEVNLNTLEDIAKGFLESQGIIKNAKAKVESKLFGIQLNVSIENYKTDGLNEKLAKIKLDLEKHMEEMLGFKLKNINFNIAKINSELAIDEIENSVVSEVVKETQEQEISLD